MVRLRVLAYDCLTIMSGILAFFCVILTIVAWTGFAQDEQRGMSMAEKLGYSVGAIVFVTLTALVRRKRAAFIREVGLYESFALVETWIKEQGSSIEELGGMVFGGSDNALVDLLEAAVDGIKEGRESMSLRELYDELQKQRKDKDLSEEQYREAVDQLLKTASGKA